MGKVLAYLFAFVAAYVFASVLAAVISFLAAIPVYFLWNWLMPELFGLKVATFWQAWGLFLLCSILLSRISVKSKSGD